MANQLPAIKHIVQLMLENRSFDQMLGYLYTANGNKSPTNQPFEGLTGNESNPDDTGREIRVFKIDGGAPHPYLMPGADPGEGFFNTNYQLFSTDDPAPGAVPDQSGVCRQLQGGDTIRPGQGLQGYAAGHRPVRNHGHVRARDAADHVQPGARIRGLRSMVLIGANPDDTQSYIRGRRDQPGPSRQSRQGLYLPQHFRKACRQEHRLGDLRLQPRSPDATGFHRHPARRRAPFRPFPRFPDAVRQRHAPRLYVSRTELRRQRQQSASQLRRRPRRAADSRYLLRGEKRARLERHAIADHLRRTWRQL